MGQGESTVDPSGPCCTAEGTLQRLVRTDHPVIGGLHLTPGDPFTESARAVILSHMHCVSAVPELDAQSGSRQAHVLHQDSTGCAVLFHLGAEHGGVWLYQTGAVPEGVLLPDQCSLRAVAVLMAAIPHMQSHASWQVHRLITLPNLEPRHKRSKKRKESGTDPTDPSTPGTGEGKKKKKKGHRRSRAPQQAPEPPVSTGIVPQEAPEPQWSSLEPTAIVAYDAPSNANPEGTPAYSWASTPNVPHPSHDTHLHADAESLEAGPDGTDQEEAVLHPSDGQHLHTDAESLQHLHADAEALDAVPNGTVAYSRPHGEAVLHPSHGTQDTVSEDTLVDRPSNVTHPHASMHLPLEEPLRIHGLTDTTPLLDASSVTTFEPDALPLVSIPSSPTSIATSSHSPIAFRPPAPSQPVHHSAPAQLSEADCKPYDEQIQKLRQTMREVEARILNNQTAYRADIAKWKQGVRKPAKEVLEARFKEYRQMHTDVEEKMKELMAQRESLEKTYAGCMGTRQADPRSLDDCLKIVNVKIERMQHRLEEMEYVRAQIYKHYEQEFQAATEWDCPLLTL